MSGRYLVELADVLRAAGLHVVEQDGWPSRARSSGGYADGRPWCVMWHHTASSASPESDASYMSFGADSKPVANLMIARDGAVWVLAAGATNTNGKGEARPFSRGTVPADSMNTYAVGVEICNNGVGEVWPAVQVEACFATSLALTSWLGLEPDDADEHSTYAPGRKIDPATADAVDGPWQPAATNSSGSWSLDDLRSELRRRSTSSAPEPAPEPPQPLPPDSSEEEFDMAFIIVNRSTGQPALVYGDGKVTGLDGGSVAEFEARYGPGIAVEDVTFNDFAGKE